MGDQAERLRELISRRTSGGARCVAIASGKGGVGKTNIAVNLAILLARHKHRVLLMDADLGLANVDVVLGLLLKRTLHDVVTDGAALSDVIVEAAQGLWVLPGASGLRDLADLDTARCEQLCSEFSALRNEFDWLLIDSAPGIAANAVAFASAADEVLLVTSPEPTAITDAYAFLKVLFERRPVVKAMERVAVIVNMVASTEQGEQWSLHLQRVAERFQRRSVRYLGSVPFDRMVGECVRRQQPLVKRAPNSPASRALTQIASNLSSWRPARLWTTALEEVTRDSCAAPVA